MINGFTLEITNQSSDIEKITLFKQGEENINVKTKVINSDYNYDSLALMAISNGFKGSGLQSEFGFIEKATIYTPNGFKKIEVQSIWNDENILIDGISNYIIIEVPPLSNGIFQLMPVDKVK